MSTGGAPVKVFREPSISGAGPSVDGCLLLSTESLSVEELEVFMNLHRMFS
jgi:hypothetical protein